MRDATAGFWRLLGGFALMGGVWGPVGPAATAADLWVDRGGLDSASCGSEANPCRTLAFAVEEAADGDVIRLGPGDHDGEGLVLEGALTLEGSPELTSRVGFPITVAAGAEVSMRWLEVDSIENSGGHLALDRLRVKPAGGPGAAGLHNDGVLSMTGCEILGGGLHNGPDGSATLLATALAGGRCITNEGAVSLVDSSLDGCARDGDGGGILNLGSLHVERSSITNSVGRVPASEAGPVRGGGLFNAGTAILVNTTIAGNVAGDPLYGRGGGIFNEGDLWLVSSTVTDNEAECGTGGGVETAGGSVRLRNTLIAGNRAGSSASFDCHGRFLSRGYNLIGVAGCIVEGDRTGDLEGVDPRLGELTGDTGAVRGVPLRFDSPALDAGNPDGCLDAGDLPIETDAVGLARAVDGDLDGLPRCDIGALEAPRLAIAVYESPSAVGIVDELNLVGRSGGEPVTIPSAGPGLLFYAAYGEGTRSRVFLVKTADGVTITF